MLLVQLNVTLLIVLGIATVVANLFPRYTKRSIVALRVVDVLGATWIFMTFGMILLAVWGWNW